MCRRIKFWTLACNSLQFSISLAISYIYVCVCVCVCVCARARVCRHVTLFGVVVGPSYIDDVKANFLWCSARSVIMSKCSANCQTHIMITTFITTCRIHKVSIFLHFNAFSISCCYQSALYAYIYVLLRL